MALLPATRGSSSRLAAVRVRRPRRPARQRELHARRRPAGMPIRIASKSVRSAASCGGSSTSTRLPGDPRLHAARGAVAGRPGLRETSSSPTRPPTARRSQSWSRLAAEDPRRAPVPMVDTPPHLDLIEAAMATAAPPRCGSASTSTSAGGPAAGGWPGSGPSARRSGHPRRRAGWRPRSPERPGTGLAGLMAYEGHIAGVGDRIPGRPLRSAAIRWMQAASERDIRRRLPRLVAAVSELAELEFVNGGGTGSLARTAAAGRGHRAHRRLGLLCPGPVRQLPLARADPGCLLRPAGGAPRRARRWSPRSAAATRPRAPPAADRLPPPYLPEGLHFDKPGGRRRGADAASRGSARDGCGSAIASTCATPRRASSCERFDSLYLVEGDRIVDQVPTYRGEGKAFL